MQLCVRNELTMAVSTVMMNWMMVFHLFMSFKNFIIVKSEFSLLCRFLFLNTNCHKSPTNINEKFVINSSLIVLLL